VLVLGQRCARAPLSLLFPEPGGERTPATQCGNRRQLRCWPLSHRGHCVAGELSTYAHRAGRRDTRALQCALNLLLGQGRRVARVRAWVRAGRRAESGLGRSRGVVGEWGWGEIPTFGPLSRTWRRLRAQGLPGPFAAASPQPTSAGLQ
jgi:hypothetical protein